MARKEVLVLTDDTLAISQLQRQVVTQQVAAALRGVELLEPILAL